MIAWLAVALAQSGPVEPEESAPTTSQTPSEPVVPAADPPFSEEITVFGESALREARWDVILALKRNGWEPVDRPDGRTAFKPPHRWMGRARLESDGRLDFTYPVVRFQRMELSGPLPDGDNPHVDRDFGGNRMVDVDGNAVGTLPSGNAALWLLPSRALLDRAYARVREDVRPELDRYEKIRRDTAIRALVDAIPARLDALWSSGEPLVGSTPIDDLAGRRRAVLAYWATRADTEEGRQATLVIERWIRNTLVDEHAPTESERGRAESERADGRRLPPAG